MEDPNKLDNLNPKVIESLNSSGVKPSIGLQ